MAQEALARGRSTDRAPTAPLVHRLVIARRTARLAVPQPVVTHAGIDLRLAKAAELFTFAAARALFALRANDFGFSRGSHSETLPRCRSPENVTVVTAKNRL